MSLTLARRYNAGIVRLNACPFGTEATGTTGYTLKDYHGNDVDAAKIKSLTGIHQTDWQGRIELSDAPRTQIYPDSENMSAIYTHSVGATWTSGYADGPDGRANMAGRLTTPATGTTYVIFLDAITTGSHQQQCSVWAKSNTGSDQSVQIRVNGSGTGVVSQTVGAAWTRIAALPVTSGISRSYIGFSNNLDIMLAYMQCWEGDSPAGVYIPTTSTPVTLTDYTLSDNQITLGQVSDGATLDWTGVIKR